MHLRLWVAGVGMGVLLVLGGLLAGPIESFAASATPTTQQSAATPQAQGTGTSTSGQNSATPQTQNSGGTSSTNGTGHNCPQDSSGTSGSSTNGG